VHNLDEWTIVGCFGRPHGIKGFITVHAFTEPRDNILSYKDWHIQTNQQLQVIKPLEITANDKHIIVKVDGYPEREDVAMLTNHNIMIKSSQLAKLPTGEYYWSQLIGMNVINQQMQLLGVVEEIIPTGSNDVLVVQGDKRHLIPYLPDDFVLKVDLSNNKIHVDWDADF
jgi:16S rRNA processing protein RimM